MISGALVGLVAGESILWVAPLGDIFVRLLKMIVMPVIFTTLVVGAASISPVELGRVGIKIVLFYMLTSALAIAIGLIMANILKPGLGLELTSLSGAAGKSVEAPALKDTLTNIIPTNPFQAIVNGNVLPTIFFAIVFGISLSYLKIEEVQGRVYRDAQEARDAVFSYIEAFYNTTRIHTSIGGKSPEHLESLFFSEQGEEGTVNAMSN